VRACVSWQAWRTNAAVPAPRLDAEYYLAWARDIAHGDVLGRGGTVAGDPFLLNPLYAYVVAPLVGVFGESPAPVLAFQALLAAATAALAAAAAKRWSGPAAAWVAGISVAFSTSLTHLDGYVAVSGLAAFLVAGTCFACAPAEKDGERGHGPIAAGLWLGLSALARPVVLFAVPFVAWLHARRAERKARAAALVVAAFAACAALSFLRNVAVSGEPVVFTAANGQNLYLGNNAAARRMRAMFTDEFRFAPREMHEDAKFRVATELGHEPSRSEISSWYAGRAAEEFREHPGESLAWYGEKARWFLSPEEPASSADIDYDRTRTPLLGLAFARTWILAALAVAGAVVCRARRDLLLGPGAVVLAHAAACTLSFPLEHYRSPAVPAMAVLAGCGVAAALDELKSGRGRSAAALLATAALAAAAGACGPQPAYRRDQYYVNSGVEALHAGALDVAERDALAALALVPDSLAASAVMLDVGKLRGRFDDARPWARRISDAQPWNPLPKVELARLDLGEGHQTEALRAMDGLVAEFPWSGTLRARRGEFRCDAHDLAGAADDFRFALAHGAEPAPWALAKCGLR
jgi:4-amino-4-deoxy-L-arabinose transferase-like glycosyltransferase